MSEKRTRSHGLSGHPFYKVIKGIMTRCYNPKHNAYHRYGGRGIGVCQEWREDRGAFVLWAEAHGWRPGLQIDRKDNDGDYSPGNCQFITAGENLKKDKVGILKPKDVNLIRIIFHYSLLSRQQIADKFCIGIRTVDSITKGRRWTSLKSPVV